MTLLDATSAPAAESGAAHADALGGALLGGTAGVHGLRLRMRERTGTGAVDGAWWPRSLNLAVELRPLLERLWADGHDVYRVSYSLGAWDSDPRRLDIAARQVKLGGFRSLDSASLSLVDSSGWRRLTLLVVPGADSGAGERALAAGGQDGDPRTAAEILAAT
jgi:hypothetical protein